MVIIIEFAQPLGSDTHKRLCVCDIIHNDNPMRCLVICIEEHSYAMERNRSKERDRSKDLERSNVKMFTHF